MRGDCRVTGVAACRPQLVGAGGVFSVLSHFGVFSFAINCSGGLPHQSAGKRDHEGFGVFGKGKLVRGTARTTGSGRGFTVARGGRQGAATGGGRKRGTWAAVQRMLRLIYTLKSTSSRKVRSPTATLAPAAAAADSPPFFVLAGWCPC